VNADGNKKRVVLVVSVLLAAVAAVVAWRLIGDDPPVPTAQVLEAEAQAAKIAEEQDKLITKPEVLVEMAPDAVPGKSPRVAPR